MSGPGVSNESWRQIESYLGIMFQSVLTPYAVLDLDLRFVAVNAAYAAVTGRTEAEVVGSDVFEAFPENPDIEVDFESPTSLRRSLNAVLRTGEMDAITLMRYDTADDNGYSERFWNVTNIPVLDAAGDVALILHHAEEVTSLIDERLRLQAGGSADDAGSPSMKRAVEEVFSRELTRLGHLNDLASSLVAASDSEQVGRAVARDGVALAGAVGGSFVIFEAERLRLLAHTGIAATAVDRWSTFTLGADREPFSDAILSGEPLFFADREAMVRAYPHLSVELDPQHHAWAALPLRVGDRISGAIGLVYDTPQQFDTSLRLVLYTLANLTAQAASRAQLLEEQRIALASVEEALQPLMDPIDDVIVSHTYHPATSSSGAGGDWYDVVALDDEMTLVAIGDVANHGAVAVGEMGRVRATVHTLAFDDLESDEIANRADRVLTRLASTHTTAIIAILDRSSMMLTWTNAGHPYPVVVAADGQARLLDATHGAPLAVGLTHRYGSDQYRLVPGDTLVLYTDGLIEHSGEDIVTAMERLRVVAAHVVATRAETDVSDALFDALRPSGHHADDIAILTLAYRPT